MNAQLGAMVALGDLQRYTGPDQRVTARADILLEPGISGIAGQSRWTGVWSSKEITNDPLDTVDGLDGRQPRWLISGNETSGLIIEPETSLSDDITTSLATIGGSVINKSSANQNDTVKVPKVEILGDNNAPAGHYAYWVSDEGVKARVNMADPFLNATNTDEEYYFRTAMAQVADPKAVTKSNGERLLMEDTDSWWKNGTQDPGKISSLKNISMFLEDDFTSKTRAELAEDPDVVNREFFHDFTLHSSGVLANVKDGGLKRDLSTALLNLPGDMRGPMFEPASGSVTLGDPGGPKWEQLEDYFSLARSGSGDQVDFRMPTSEQVGVTPVLTRFNLVIQVFAERLSTASTAPGYVDQVTDYQYYVGIFPLITIWNPYDKGLKIPDLGLQFDMRGIVLRDNPIGGDLVAMLLSRDDINQPADQRRKMIGMTINGGVIPAGMAVNYTPPVNSKVSLANASLNVLKQGASDTLIRGFFHGPINIEDSIKFPGGTGKDFYVSYGASNFPIPFGGTKDVGQGSSSEITSQDPSLASTDFTKGGLWSTVVNLYANPNLNREQRFFTLTTDGIGKIYLYNGKNTWAAQNRSPRVVLFSDLGASSGSIYNIGASVTNSYSDISDFDLSDINNFAGGLAMVTVIKNLVNSNIRESSKSVNLLSQFNPRAPKSFEHIHMKEAQQAANRSGSHKNPNMGYRQYTKGLKTKFNPDAYRNWTDGTDNIYSSIGLSNLRVAAGSDKMILFEAPAIEPISVGQLMHANLMNASEISHGYNGVPGWEINYQQVHTTPAIAIGNSIANVHLPLNETRAFIDRSSGKDSFQKHKIFDSSGIDWWPSNSSLNGAIYDYSYELNNVLWDKYFFSGLDPSRDGFPEFPLPNSQIKRRPISEGSSAIAQEADLRQERLAATHLMLDGAFNINSTSVAAWESILGAMRDIYTLGEGVTESQEQWQQRHNYSRFVNPIMRSAVSPFSDPLDPEIGSSRVTYDSDHESIMAGYRSLTDKEIAKLADSIVYEIRRRSCVKQRPFLSLSNFINRSIDQEDFTGSAARKRFMHAGAVQSAIDQSGLNGRAPFDALGNNQNGNDGLWEENYIYEPHIGATPKSSSKYAPYLEDSVAAIEGRPLMEGAPGFLTQADVLSKIGGKLNARSDTFMIRSYGNSSGLLGRTNDAESYFELVVQRTPEYLDSLNNPEAETINLNTLNEKFGRRYEIVSQRWINKGDI